MKIQWNCRTINKVVLFTPTAAVVFNKRWRGKLNVREENTGIGFKKRKELTCRLSFVTDTVHALAVVIIVAFCIYFFCLLVSSI